MLEIELLYSLHLDQYIIFTGAIPIQVTEKNDTGYYRHSVHQFSLFGQSKEFVESLETKAAEEVLEKGMLKRTLSDSKIEAFTNHDLTDTKDLKADSQRKTLPNSIARRNVRKACITINTLL